MRDSKRDTDVQNSLLDSVGEGEGGMIGENGIETGKISYMKRKKKRKKNVLLYYQFKMFRSSPSYYLSVTTEMCLPSDIKSMVY